MKKLSTRILFLFLAFSGFTSAKLVAQVSAVYETVGSGNWDDFNVWQYWASGTIGVGTSISPTTTIPGATDKVVIHNGHTISLNSANRACNGITIESGGKLWQGSASAFRLQIGAGGTNYPYPLNDSLINNGVLGGASDGLYVEQGARAGTLTLTGSGSYDIGKIRTPGGNGGTVNGVFNLIIDANINLYQQSNYALTIVYNPTLTDNYTMTINAGKTVKVISPSGYFHNSQSSATYGRYLYDIKGTLDLSTNTQTRIIAPAAATSAIVLNVDGGILKTSAAFKADTLQTVATIISAGVLAIGATNGGLIDASNSTVFTLGNTTDGLGGTHKIFLALDATGRLQQTVGATEVKFPIGIYNPNPALLINSTANAAYLTNSGTPDIFSIGLKGTFDNALNDASKVVNRQWDIQEAVAGGSNVTVRLAWLTADQGSNFSPSAPINTIHYSGGWSETPASITGSGTDADPYISSTSGFTSFSPFGVDNTLGVVPVTFVNIKAAKTSNGIQVDWANATELNINNYIVEKSTDGLNFSPAASIVPKSNNGSLNSYSWLDAAPANGTNYYRIEAIDQSYKIDYSTIAQATISGSGKITIYPNPVKENTVYLKLNGLPNGIYNVRLIANNGQAIVTDILNYTGGNTAEFNLTGDVKPGAYTLEVVNPDGAITNLQLLRL